MEFSQLYKTTKNQIKYLEKSNMTNRNCFVLLQSRSESEYNDFVGKFYHFPKKYLKQLSSPNIEFMYYEPKKKGEGVYFGYGKIKKIFEDKIPQVKNSFQKKDII